MCGEVKVTRSLGLMQSCGIRCNHVTLDGQSCEQSCDIGGNHVIFVVNHGSNHVTLDAQSCSM